jgi:hypothetical protein
VEATPGVDYNAGIRPYLTALPFGCLGCLASVFDRPGRSSMLRKRRPKVSLVGPMGGWDGGLLGFATWDRDFGSAVGGVS